MISYSEAPCSATLRAREVARVGAEMAEGKGLPFRAATDGENVSGKFAVVEKSHEFNEFDQMSRSLAALDLPSAHIMPRPLCLMPVVCCPVAFERRQCHDQALMQFGEMEPHDESTITFGQKEIEVHELATYVDISNRLLQDAPQAETEVRAALAEDFAQKEAHAFLWGDGIKKPGGLMVNSAIPEVANGHATTLSTDALIKLMYSLPAPYRNKGAWAMNGITLGILRTLKDTQGQYVWQPSLQAGQPETILGRPVIEMVDLGDIAANEQPIVYGDFQAYRIVDRLSMSVLVDPYTQARQRITITTAPSSVWNGANSEKDNT
ncbi:Phage capsid family protein [Paracoccus haematequi]|uniref:Phage capsid family protein n=2 Tax=Paracoccus haematequi TaxID=2491866 RepID=A0A447IJH5_9RHOB|nr:Phage capsid family protein [Paracoccus haematequi]